MKQRKVEPITVTTNDLQNVLQTGMEEKRLKIIQINNAKIQESVNSLTSEAKRHIKGKRFYYGKSFLEKCVEIDPQNAVHYSNLSSCVLRMGKIKPAIIYANHALSLQEKQITEGNKEKVSINATILKLRSQVYIRDYRGAALTLENAKSKNICAWSRTLEKESNKLEKIVEGKKRQPTLKIERGAIEDEILFVMYDEHFIVNEKIGIYFTLLYGINSMPDSLKDEVFKKYLIDTTGSKTKHKGTHDILGVCSQCGCVFPHPKITMELVPLLFPFDIKKTLNEYSSRKRKHKKIERRFREEVAKLKTAMKEENVTEYLQSPSNLYPTCQICFRRMIGEKVRRVLKLFYTPTIPFGEGGPVIYVGNELLGTVDPRIVKPWTNPIFE